MHGPQAPTYRVPKYGSHNRRPSGPVTKINPKPQPVSLLELARRQVVPAYKGQRAVIDRLLLREDQAAKQRADYMQMVYANFARFLQGIPGAIQGIYSEAANRTAEYARGSEMGLRLQEGQSAHGVQDVLNTIGAPAGQAPPQYGAAERLYALTGYLPAATLTGQGAAWGAYGATLPGIYAQKGIADIAAALAESGKRKTEITDELLKIGASESADILKQLGILRTERESTRQFNARLREQRRQFNVDQRFRERVAKAENLLDNKKYNLSIAELEAEIAESNQRLRIAQQNANTAVIRAEEARLDRLRRAKQGAITARNENRRIVIAEYNSGAITQREMQRRLGNPKWRDYPNTKKPVGGKGKGGTSSGPFPES
jgi:hypothetical protein